MLKSGSIKDPRYVIDKNGKVDFSVIIKDGKIQKNNKIPSVKGNLNIVNLNWFFLF